MPLNSFGKGRGRMNDVRFYDTCSLLLAGESLFEEGKPAFKVSSITFKELERIKTAANKDADVKYSARLLLHLFDTYPDRYEVIIHKQEYENCITQCSLEINDDTRILSDAIYANSNDDVIFVTNDLSLKHIANLFFSEAMIESVDEESDTYTGYLEVTADEASLAEFYQDTKQNQFNLLCGQYLILRNQEGEVVDLRVWTGEDHRYLNTKPFNSNWFGKVEPYQGDIYQKLLFDSLRSNKITLVKGPAGSGKSFISLGYLMSAVEHHNLDKIIVFCNTVATANSAKLGFYPGTRLEKLLDSQIGNFLIGKFGGLDGVQQLIGNGKLELLPLSDIRGFDTSNMKAGVYITEAQNLDRSLIKLALQRIGEDSICVIDGDNKQQVDLKAYEGYNNGIRAVSKAFRGEDIYGEIELQKIYRSRIAQISERIC